MPNPDALILYAGVDGGGSKTELVLVDQDGNEVARRITSTSNPSVIGHEPAATVLRDVFQQSLDQLPDTAQIARAWLGLSGASRQADEDALRPLLTGIAGDIRITNDAELLIGALPNGVGVVVIAGTGSIALGVNAIGNKARAGGWGLVFGDQGSGYGLAREAFRAYSMDVDQRGVETALTASITNELQLPDQSALITWVYDKARTKQDIAQIGPLVLDIAEQGDAVANQIVHDAAKELVELIVTLGRRLDFNGSLPVGLAGGLLTNNAFYRNLVIEQIQQTWGAVEPQIIRDPALSAARSLIPQR